MVGKSYETGIKFNLLEDRIWGSVTLYQLELQGFATFNSTVNAFVVSDTFNKGAEFELSVEPVRGLQVIATAFTADGHGTGGSRVNQSYKEAWSLWTKYNFPSGPLKGLSLGAGFFHRSPLFYSTGTNTPGYTTLDATVGYTRRQWSLTVSARNLTDEIYNIGSTGANNIDVSIPPTVQSSITYRF